MIKMIQSAREKLDITSLRHACKNKTLRFWTTQWPHSMSRVICLLILSTPHSTMLATGQIPNIVCVTELQNKPKVACTQLKALLGYFLSIYT